MKISLTIPDDIAPVIRAIATATRRPVEEVVLHELGVFTNYAEDGEFEAKCEELVREDETDAREFVGRIAGQFEALTGRALDANDLQLMVERLDGEIDEDGERLLRIAADIFRK